MESQFLIITPTSAPFILICPAAFQPFTQQNSKGCPSKAAEVEIIVNWL
jgi:hypothetical protein